MSGIKGKEVPQGAPPRKPLAGIARALLWLIAVSLVLPIAANLDVVWEKGIELLQPGSNVDVEGVSADVIQGLAARRFLYSRKTPGTPPLKIEGRNIFVSYDPLLRRDVHVGFGSAAVECRILPAAGSRPTALPLIGSFLRFSIHCPEVRFHILWNDWIFSCEESRVVCEGASGEGGFLSWRIPRMTMRKGDNLIAQLGEVEITDRFASEGAVTFASLTSGFVLADIGHVGFDMEVLSNMGNREKFLVTGRFTGKANVSLARGRLKRLEAKFLSEGGGTVALSRDIIDRYLGSMAPGPHRDSMKIVLEHLKNYTFTRGVLRLETADDVIMIDVDLEGESGSYSLEIPFHGFIINGRIVSNRLISIGRKSQ